MSVAAIKAALSAQFASLATATTPLDPNPATNADLIYGRMATALYNALQVGRTNGSFPAAGEIGELKDSFVAAGSIALVNNVAKTVTSITLPPGDYDVSGVIDFAAPTTLTYEVSSIGVVANTLYPNFAGYQVLSSSQVFTNNRIATPVVAMSLTTTPTTTIYLVAQAGFTGALGVGGYIRARRVS